MRRGTFIRFGALFALSVLFQSCADLKYSASGMEWDVRPDGRIQSGTIRPRRAVYLRADGRLERGRVTVYALRDGQETGTPLVLTPETVHAIVGYGFEDAEWSFRAQADASVQGTLYVSISDM